MARQRTKGELVPEFSSHMPLSKADAIAYPKRSRETSYETPPCRNSEKIEHRTSNIDGAALYRI